MSINGLNPLAYIGVDAPNPAAQILTSNTDPTVNDSLNVNIGDIWINQNRQPPGAPEVPQRIFMLTALVGSQATWTEIGATDNVINVLGGTNINVVTAMGDATVNLNPSVVLAGSLTTGTFIDAGGPISGPSLFLENDFVGAVAAPITFTKTRAGGVIVSGDDLGSVQFLGNDGVGNPVSARILVESTGTIAAGRVPSTMSFYTSPDAVSATVERVVIDENGTVNINQPVGNNNAITAENDIVTNSGSFRARIDSAGAGGPGVVFFKSDGGGAVVPGDLLGVVFFNGYDGTNDRFSSYIVSETTGTVAATRVPSKIKFGTAPDQVASVPVDRVIIDANGTVTVNAPTGGGSAIETGSDIVALAGNIEATAGDVVALLGNVAAADRVTGATLVADGDLGGLAATTSLTNATVANVPGGGTLTIDSQSANPGTQAGFIKVYVGTTTAYIPYFTNIAP